MKYFLFRIRSIDKKSVPIEVLVESIKLALVIKAKNIILIKIFLRNIRLLKPNEMQQTEALIAALSEIIWNIGEKSKVVVALPGDVIHIPHSHTYFQDSVTEKVIFNAVFNNDIASINLFLLILCFNSFHSVVLIRIHEVGRFGNIFKAISLLCK